MTPLFLTALTVIACRGSAPDSPPPPPGPPGEVLSATTPPPPPPMPGEHVAGASFITWTSASCGERSYPRSVTLNPDFSYTTEELVSPCPPDAKCVWSGIVNTQGTWKEEADRVTFAETQGGGQGMPRPTELVWEGGRTSLVEVQGETRCAYVQSQPGQEPPAK
ncbi:hypothetical protein L6R49_05615 [Myxococcota bacterium]|nr:hypothetical protein [Myxococcota bacterium]